jgi:hypothetical protein
LQPKNERKESKVDEKIKLRKAKNINKEKSANSKQNNKSFE